MRALRRAKVLAGHICAPARPWRAGAIGAGLLAGSILLSAIVDPSQAAYNAVSSGSASGFSTAPDWLAPAVSATGAGRTFAVGTVSATRTYYIYASVSDSGVPASGTSTVTANVTNLTSGATAVALASGSWTLSGVTYNFRSSLLTAGSVSAGATTYSVTTLDNASNSTTTAFPVTVDNTGPTASSWSASNTSGGQAGRPDTGDTVTFGFSEPIDPDTVLSGWDGTATGVTIRLIDNGPNDRLGVRNAANTANLPFGIVERTGKFVNGGDVDFTGSTMTRSGSTITVVLGTPSGTPRTELTSVAPTWTPSATPTDLAGNPTSTAVLTAATGVLF